MRASQLFNADTLAAVGAAAAALISMVATIFMYVQVRQSDKGRMSSICLEISKRYDEIYPGLVSLESRPIRWDEFDNKYPELYKKLGSKEWKRLRRAAGFFELVGVMVEDGMIKPDLLFKFMNIRPCVWLANRAIIMEMRRGYFPELWIYWERLVKTYYESSDQRWNQQQLDCRKVLAQGSAPSRPRPTEARRAAERVDDGTST